MPWHTLEIEGITRIEREVARFTVEPICDDLPMRFRIKILEDQDGDFRGYPEIAIRRADGEPDVTSGRGHTVEEALAATIRSVLLTRIDKPTIDDDAIWWDPRF